MSLFSNQVKLLKENYQTFDADEKRILQTLDRSPVRGRINEDLTRTHGNVTPAPPSTDRSCIVVLMTLRRHITQL